MVPGAGLEPALRDSKSRVLPITPPRRGGLGDRTRTCDLRVRTALLYPTELPRDSMSHWGCLTTWMALLLDMLGILAKWCWGRELNPHALAGTGV